MNFPRADAAMLEIIISQRDALIRESEQVKARLHRLEHVEDCARALLDRHTPFDYVDLTAERIALREALDAAAGTTAIPSTPETQPEAPHAQDGPTEAQSAALESLGRREGSR
ncbi:MAG TPA: hypothetical protein VIY56_17345 [Vicinamibacterales bacterium]